MKRIFKIILIYEIIILLIFSVGYFVYESKQPKDTFSINSDCTIDSVNISGLEGLIKPILEIEGKSPIRENLNTSQT